MIFNSSLIIGLSLSSTTNSPLLAFSPSYFPTSSAFCNLNFKRFSKYAFYYTSLYNLSVHYSHFTDFLSTAIKISNIGCATADREVITNRFSGNCFNATYCTFQNIQSNSSGGAIYITWKDPTLTFIDYCTFTGCSARKEGGAIYFGIYPVQFGILFATNSFFTRCMIDNIYDYMDVSGGAIYIYGEILNVSNTTFTNCGVRSNVGNCRGGAIYADVCNASQSFYLTVFISCYVSYLPPPPTSTPTQSATASPTPSNGFTASQYFTMSQSFTSSSHFTQSNTFSNSFYFSPSHTFTKSIQFTKSHSFTKSGTFSHSSHFTLSSHFTKSNTFSNSKLFTASKPFSGTSVFTMTSRFTKTGSFSKSHGFTNSKSFTHSKAFTKSNAFSPSSPFTKTSPFTMTSHFTHSKIFSGSHHFTVSSHFTKSNVFTRSRGFTKSSVFTKSNVFTKTEAFTMSETFTPSESPSESVPPASTQLPDPTDVPASTKLPPPTVTEKPPDPTVPKRMKAKLLSFDEPDYRSIHLFNSMSRLVDHSEGGAVYLQLSENVHRTVDLYGTTFIDCSGSHGSALFSADRIDLVLNLTRFVEQNLIHGDSPIYSFVCMNSDTRRNNSLYVESVGISNVDSINLISSTRDQLTFLNNPYDTSEAFAEGVNPTKQWFTKPPYPDDTLFQRPYNQMPSANPLPPSSSSSSSSSQSSPSPFSQTLSTPSPVASRSYQPTISPSLQPAPPTETTSPVGPASPTPTASNADNSQNATKKGGLSPAAIFFIALACLAFVIGLVWVICLFRYTHFNCRRKRSIQPDFGWRGVEYY